MWEQGTLIEIRGTEQKKNTENTQKKKLSIRNPVSVHYLNAKDVATVTEELRPWRRWRRVSGDPSWGWGRGSP